MKTLSIALAGAALAVVLAIGSGSGLRAEQNYVPGGHAYGPNYERLPRLNSKRDKLNAQADIYEAEIRRKRLELRIQMERMRLHHDLNLHRPGRSYFEY